MNKLKRDNDAKKDSNKRPAQKMPREMAEPFSVSENTLNMMDSSMENLKAGKSGKAINFER